MKLTESDIDNISVKSCKSHNQNRTDSHLVYDLLQTKKQPEFISTGNMSNNRASFKSVGGQFMALNRSSQLFMNPFPLADNPFY